MVKLLPHAILHHVCVVFDKCENCPLNPQCILCPCDDSLCLNVIKWQKGHLLTVQAGTVCSKLDYDGMLVICWTHHLCRVRNPQKYGVFLSLHFSNKHGTLTHVSCMKIATPCIEVSHNFGWYNSFHMLVCIIYMYPLFLLVVNSITHICLWFFIFMWWYTMCEWFELTEGTFTENTNKKYVFQSGCTAVY